jgi:hypothetical protein
MLISEVSICRNIGEAEALDLLRRSLAKANLPLPPAL